MAKTEKVEKVETSETVPTFFKSSILNSKRFANRRDALKVLLKEDEPYTLEQVEKILEDFYNERVK